MGTLFPGAIDAFSTKIDNVTNVMAADVNDLQDAVVAIETVVVTHAPNPNLLYHSLTYDIWPGGYTFNDVSDDSYVAGVWNALWGGNAPDVTAELATGALIRNTRWLKCLIDTNGTQAGFVQFLSSEETKDLRGKILSFSVNARGFNVSNLRCAILKWTGTADAVTSDVVATWATGNPTLATNWDWLGATPASQALSGSASVPDRIKYENATVPDDTTVNNLAVFVWTPDSENSTDWFGLANAKLEVAPAITAFQSSGKAEEEARTFRFAQPLNIILDGYVPAVRGGTNEVACYMVTPIFMRSIPVLINASDLSTTLGTGAKQVDIYNLASGLALTATGNVTMTVAAGKSSVALIFAAATSFSGSAGNYCRVHQTAGDLTSYLSSQL